MSSQYMKAADFSREALTFYEKTLLVVSRSLLTYAQFGEKFPLKEKNGKTINFARYKDLGAAGEISEAITPIGSKIIKEEITATLKQYGDWVGISDVTTMTGFDPEIAIASEKLGRQEGLTLDTVLRNELMQGTNAVYSTTSVTASSGVKDKIDGGHLRKIHRFLRSNDVPMITKMIDPSTGIATQPIPAAYVAIGHTDMITDLEGLENSGFVPVHKYSSNRGVFEGEVGTFAGIRFILTSNAPVLYAKGDTPSTGIQASGANKTDVYQTIIFGEGAFAEVPLNKGNSGIIIKAKTARDTTDTSDPLNQRSTVGCLAF